MKLYPDLQIFHDGTPVHLLHLIRKDEAEEIWLVKPLFVQKQNEVRTFRPHDRYTHLHTQGAL